MLAAEVAQYLHDNGVGVFDPVGVTGDIFIEALPDTPDACVMIRSTGGPRADTRLHYDNPTIQVLVRGTQNPISAHRRAQQIYNLLHAMTSQAIVSGGSYVVSCQGMQSAPNHIGQDANRRHEYTLNFVFDIRNDDSRRP